MIPGLDLKTIKLINKWKWIAILAPIIFYVLIFILLIGMVVALVKNFSQDNCGGFRGFVTGIMAVGEKEAAYEALCRLGGRLGEGDSGGGGTTDGWDCYNGAGSCTGDKKIEGISNSYSDYIDNINKAAAIYMEGDSAALVALIQIESGYDTGADNSKSSALGLGQFLDSTAKSMAEFVGGDDEHGYVWPAGKIDNTKDDARLDPKRSIYAAARYATTLSAEAKKECSGKIGGSKWACYYKWNHNRGCIRNKSGTTGPGTEACKKAGEAEESMISLYGNILESGSCGSGDSSSVVVTAAGSSSGQAVLDQAKSKLGVKYRYWGRDSLKLKGGKELMSGIDCVGLQYVAMRNAGLISDSFSDFEIFQDGIKIYNSFGSPVLGNKAEIKMSDLDQLQPGDLLFFSKGGFSGISHAGIYAGKESESCHRYYQANGSPVNNKSGTCKGVCKVTYDCLEDRMNGSGKKHVFASRLDGVTEDNSSSNSNSNSNIDCEAANNENYDDVPAIRKSGKIEDYSDNDILKEASSGATLRFDTAFAENLISAIQDAKRNGISIKIASGYRSGSGGSNHNSGAAVDINAYKGNDLICAANKTTLCSSSELQSDGRSSLPYGCSEEVRVIMARHGILGDLCKRFKTKTRNFNCGDCNHFSLTGK